MASNSRSCQRIFLYTFWLLLSLNYLQPAIGQGFLKVQGKSIVNEKGENILLRGMGLGGWMLQEGYMLKIQKDGQQHRIRQRMDSLIGSKRTEEFYDAWLSSHTTKKDIDSMKAWGFNSVRLPMHYNLYTLPVESEPVPGKHTWLERGFALTDSLLKWCKENKIYLFLDLHAAPGGQGNDLNISDGDTSKISLWESASNREKTVALWKKLAQRYAGEPWIGGYDIINEPNWGFTDPDGDRNGLNEKNNGPLLQLMKDITRAIREVDTSHIVIIEGNGWGNNYNGILPPWDDNMVLSFHKYWNKNEQADIQHIIHAREQYNVPVWLGETGENSNVWFTQAIRLLESNNIGWAWWPLKKIGFNNPLEIRSNPRYEKLVAYWNGKGPKPSPGLAYEGLMELAADTKLENNIFHRDVIDAMFRQPFTTETLSFKSHVIDRKLKIQAVDYDLGRNGFAYFDLDTADYRVSGQPGAGNKGRTYRNDGVDIMPEPGKVGNYFVGNIEKNEWLEYTIHVSTSGWYSVQAELSADSGKFSIYIDKKLLESKMLRPSFQKNTWKWIRLKNVFLERGKHTIRFQADQSFRGFRCIMLERIKME